MPTAAGRTVSKALHCELDPRAFGLHGNQGSLDCVVTKITGASTSPIISFLEKNECVGINLLLCFECKMFLRAHLSEHVVSSRGRSFGRSLKLQEVEPCWRKLLTSGKTWGFLAQSYLYPPLSDYVVSVAGCLVRLPLCIPRHDKITLFFNCNENKPSCA